ncbi:uncharacterized protein LY89DRAFT_783868 [Mollisia scopiformis]|uniref:Uncharacterized protein n=1 Tax=Mollisia scopiformis TaxID=149040 RepID=A0A194X3L0_MOLSC|nr:uncharacterized protein LY89DRAFT_783868 [Mollisia scopiformis]KUJ14783.1 hypothetical protein LY89DRAFT_783868 [Mollisia scopiformis]
MAATLTATPSAHVFEKQDVATHINFWKKLDTPPKVIDLTQPNAEQDAANAKEHDDPHPVTVHDVRGEEQNYTLAKNGFQYVSHEVPDLKDLSGEEEVKRVLVPLTEELVKKTTGAFKTIVLQTRIRNVAEAGQKDRLAENFPAYGPHCDMTPVGAENTLQNVIQDPEALAALKAGRVMVINVWRPLKIITRDPLSLCDWQSVEEQNDIVPNRMIFRPGIWHEFGKIAYSEKQKWCYLSQQRPDEPVLFMQYDNKSNYGGLSLPHTAFVDSRFVEEEPRQSIEIKMYAFLKE